MDDADESIEVVEGEVVDNDALPAVLADPARILAGALARPVITQHTVLRPGELPTTERPTYTAADFYVSEETAQAIDKQSKPKNTDRNYRSQRGMFERWCAEMGRVANPCTTATYIEYIAALIARGTYSPNTIKAHKSAVRSMQPEDAKPGTAVVNGLIKEYAKTWNKRNRVKKAPAIPDDNFGAMVATCDQRHPIGIRDRWALIAGRAYLHRRRELGDLLIAQIEVDDDGVAHWVAMSKTDQDAIGEESWAPAEPDDVLLCPVDATRAWLNCLWRLGVRDGAAYRALTVAGTLQNRSTATAHGEHVSGDAINDMVRGRAFAAGLPNWQQITAHSLRRTGAQRIAAAGGDPTKQGRWKPGSSVVKREYLDRAQSRAENPWHLVAAKRRETQQ
ncbi:integrase [Streptomyces cavernae]|uniref:integrase n=1 Tax=Streptomyces cavernae TaxID=2259034 RepID=UPI000FEBEB16|nr:integrase [Streptomyces cavernae]